MTHFAIITHDGPEGAALRTAHLRAHLAHVETILDKFAIAGPLRDAAGAPNGSLLVVKAADATEAEAILKSDPYFKAGVWSEWHIHPFSAVAGEWVGGKTW